MSELADVETPALLLDLVRLRANCARMLDRCRTLGVHLRPHMKTLKSIGAAREAMDPELNGIAVSTLKEAEYFAEHGVPDIQYAVCLSPDKLPRAAALAERVERFSLFTDSVEAAEAIAAHPPGSRPLRVWIEVDSGQHRTGVDPDGADLLAIAAVLAGSRVVIEGVATHGGHSYGLQDKEAIAGVAEEERRAVTRAAEQLREAGHKVERVSAGSTPTATHACSAQGLTELRPGVYMAGDLFQAGIGSHEVDDIAVSVLATVISHGRDPGRIHLDAGALALSKDRSTAVLGQADAGYGLILDAQGQPRFGTLRLSGVNQEHGEIRVAHPRLFEHLPLGQKVRVLPNHACMTTAMYDQYVLVDGDRVIGRWGKTGGW